MGCALSSVSVLVALRGGGGRSVPGFFGEGGVGLIAMLALFGTVPDDAGGGRENRAGDHDEHQAVVLASIAL